MKISGIQIFWLIWLMNTVMTILNTLGSTIAISKQDAWISIIIAGLIALLVTYVATKVSLLYPNQTFIEYSQTILGKWLGKVIVIPYFILWYSISGTILRISSDFIHISLFHKTPLFVIILTLMMVVIYVTYKGGIEAIGRCGEVFGPIILMCFILVFILALSNLHWQRIMPVYAYSGWKSILHGALIPTTFFQHGADMLLLQSFMAKPNNGPSRAIWGVGIASITVCIATVMIVMTFGPGLSARMWYPYFEMVRYVYLMEFIQNIDAIFVIIWVLSIFVKLSVLLFMMSYGTAQWLGVTNWRNIIWIVSPIIVILAMLYPNGDVPSVDYPQKYLVPIVLPVNLVGIPLLLWIVGIIRKKSAQSSF